MSQALSERRSVRILVVDDEKDIVSYIRELLTRRGYDVEGVSDPRQVDKVFQAFQPDLCVLDFRMPHISGSTLLDSIKAADPLVEVVFLTAEDETTLAVDLMKRGAIDFLLKPVEPNQLSLSISRALEHQRLVKENTTYRMDLEQLVKEQTKALKEALGSLTRVHDATLEALSTALDFRDQSTSGHSRRVANLTAGAAREFGVTGSELVQIEHGALLHDVGKLKIPDSILWKPDKLTDAEWVTMRRHVEFGYQFLLNVDFLKDAAEIVYAHHEKFDGSGYPRGLAGSEIPFGARIFAVVDSVDAMIYERPYNIPVNFPQAAAEIRRCSGTHYDPEVIDITLEYLSKNVPRWKR